MKSTLNLRETLMVVALQGISSGACIAIDAILAKGKERTRAKRAASQLPGWAKELHQVREPASRATSQGQGGSSPSDL